MFANKTKIGQEISFCRIATSHRFGW